MKLVLLLGFSYIFGSIPFGFLVGLSKGVDIRKLGSGNIGATNVSRVLGKKLAFIVMLGDIFKGFFPVWLAQYLKFSDYIVITAGLLAVLGHCLPIWLKFKGGRGVATGLGVMIGISPAIAGLAFVIWLLIAGLTGYVSVASTVAAISAPILLATFHKSLLYIGLGLLLTILIIIRHIPNYRRLIKGTEHRLGGRDQRR